MQTTKPDLTTVDLIVPMAIVDPAVEDIDLDSGYEITPMMADDLREQATSLGYREVHFMHASQVDTFLAHAAYRLVDPEANDPGHPAFVACHRFTDGLHGMTLDWWQDDVPEDA